MRQRKHKDAWVRFHATEAPKTNILLDANGVRSISLIGRGRGMYLWIGLNDKCVATFSGQQALRTLAKAILE